MINYISGIISGGYLIAALFFFRFWRRTGDVLFAVFGVSFVLFAVSQGASLLSDVPREDRSWIYLFRLAGFALLLGCIIWKNIDRRTPQ
jgi:peptidoglycan/LPS O-acetylase OafA/YrhL